MGDGEGASRWMCGNSGDVETRMRQGYRQRRNKWPMGIRGANLATPTHQLTHRSSTSPAKRRAGVPPVPRRPSPPVLSLSSVCARSSDAPLSDTTFAFVVRFQAWL